MMAKKNKMVQDQVDDVADGHNQVDDKVIEGQGENSELEQIKAELADANQAKLRALADFKNFQRRSAENETLASLVGIAKVVRAIIPAIEQMNLAIEHLEDDAVAKGFIMAKEELLRGLFDCGISAICPEIGDPLDPLLHEAMMRQKSDDFEADHIVMVMQSGYRLGDMIICPAKVALSE